MSQTLIAALQNPALFSHPVEQFQVIETHISWVLLTGPYVYKIKKPMNFGFLDFTTLSAREHFCHEELKLNGRLTEDLYLEVLPITGTTEAPQLGGAGEAIEFALKIRQFPQDGLLSTLQAKGELTTAHIDEMARQIADFHMSTPRVLSENPLGSPEYAMAPVTQNFEQILPFLSEKADLVQLNALEAWANASYARLEPLMARRKAEGFIRECHGDIHLGNMTLIDGKVVIFDCIEFNEPFRMADPVADVGFLAMDLAVRGERRLAGAFVDAWVAASGDTEARQLLPA